MRIRRLRSTCRALTDQTASNGLSAAHTGTACSISSEHSAIGSACGGGGGGGGDNCDDDDNDDDDDIAEAVAVAEAEAEADAEAEAAAGADARNGGVRAAARSSGDEAVSALSSS